MSQKYVQKRIKSNYIPSKFLQSKKVYFDSDGGIDKKTGEITSKGIAVTCTVVEGTKSNFPPKCVVTLKLGTDSMRFIAESFDSLAQMFYEVSMYVQDNAREGNNIKVKEESDWRKIQAHRDRVRDEAKSA